MAATVLLIVSSLVLTATHLFKFLPLKKKKKRKKNHHITISTKFLLKNQKIKMLHDAIHVLACQDHGTRSRVFIDSVSAMEYGKANGWPFTINEKEKLNKNNNFVIYCTLLSTLQ